MKLKFVREGGQTWAWLVGRGEENWGTWAEELLEGRAPLVSLLAMGVSTEAGLLLQSLSLSAGSRVRLLGSLTSRTAVPMDIHSMSGGWVDRIRAQLLQEPGQAEQSRGRVPVFHHSCESAACQMSMQQLEKKC